MAEQAEPDAAQRYDVDQDADQRSNREAGPAAGEPTDERIDRPVPSQRRGEERPDPSR